MFSWLKNRLVRRLKALAYAANLVTAAKLINEYRGDLPEDSQEADARLFRATAIVNHFFGHPPRPNHERAFDLPLLYDEGYAWLDRNPLFKELVVQSLRAQTIIKLAQSAAAAADELNVILVRYGKEIPQSAGPDVFEALVASAMAELPPQDRASITRRLA